MIEPELYYIEGDEQFPGNPLPVLHYRDVLNIPWWFPATRVKQLFRQHGWSNNWTNGIYTYAHYHSNTHEVMAVIKGSTVIWLGGEEGVTVDLIKGDVLVIPAGVAHLNLGKEKDVICVGGYPGGKDFDINYGKPQERPWTDKKIYALSLPSMGPIYGENDPLLQVWGKTRRQITILNETEIIL
ncbi:cupin domain-containing protein [Flavihumibacter petaseus]|uniref:Cupin type-2 domain-containing protein n=1 Tax=Flavihumibacter petaseus NBRC 106054 TaxID=1220578 RepID=A0A0E9MZW7_9BACT|nr:cupin domain-containing protein [Flavihumibacter petaseus]GAO43083.1 hypothetical protein FPE01S_02_01870 [Flavihumibacter petaseus NBRC 106054]